MILSGSPKRACIYFIYDKDGIIDDYIVYQLKDLRENIAFMHCVINGRLTPDGRKKLEAIADEVYVRENKEMDVGAYKAAIEYIGWDKLGEFDELVLMNNTCFGPVYPFKECFDWAAAQDIDFWGLTMGICEMHNFPKEYAAYAFAREHIQSYFLVVRKTLLCSQDFRRFMESRPEIGSYSDSGLYYENVFTNYFRIRGYSFATYCDCTELLKLHNNPVMIFPLQLTLEYKCPVFKKKLFTESYTDLLTQCVGQPAQEILEFLDSSSSYSADLIWQHLLRTQDLSVMVRNCHLVRILPRDYTLPLPKTDLSIGVIFHAYYPDLFDKTIEYLSCFPKNVSFLITTNSEDKKILFDKKFTKSGYSFETRVIENRGRDMSALLVGAVDFVNKYDVICFAHDKKTTQQSPGSVGLSWAYELSENMFGKAEYIENIISLFAKEHRLGIAFPPYPLHNDYSGLSTGWVGNYEATKKLLNEFNIEVPTHPQTLCVAPLGTNFWFRSKALKKIFDIGWSYKNFPREPITTDGTILHAIERTFAYFAQDAGYYPAFIMNDIYARIEFTNLEIQKVGSQQMHSWLHISKMEAIYNKSVEQIAQQDEITYVPSQQEILAYHASNINYGVKHALKMLAIALRIKYPRMWGVLLPLRRLGQAVLRIK